MPSPFAHPEHVTALLAAIVESSDDAIVSKTLDGIITSWNAGAERIFGYTAAEAVGQPITLIIPPDRLDEERTILEHIARGESVKHLQTVRIAKGGRPVDISVTVSAVRDAGGRVIGASKVARDIGERVRADRAQALMAAIVDSSDEAIVSKTLGGIIQSWNRGAERLFGYTANEAVGQHITLIIPPGRYAEEDEVLARIRRGEVVDHYDTVRIRKDGREIDISLTVSPVRDSSGRVIGASKIARDISERLRLDAERAALLEREQQAREEAEMLNRSKDQFLAVLSHELRTPLNAIYGWARLLHEGSLDTGLTRHAAEVIVRNARTQLQLVEDLLDVSRIVTGTMRLDLQPTDLAPIVGDCVDGVRPLAGAKAIELGVVLGRTDAVVMGAPDRLRQVVSNLLINAVKFTSEGGRIDVELRDAGDHVEAVVSDTGEGIEPELLPHIFDRFRQGDSSSTRAHGGLGLGLALVRHLVELHGGSVHAHSEGPGRGATFVVSLPRAEGAVAPAGTCAVR